MLVQPKDWQVPFPLYAARPYTLGLESLLWSNNSPLPSPYNVLSVKGIHDLYHVEPQTKCMLTASGKHAVDMFVRCAPLACLGRSVDPLQAVLQLRSAQCKATKKRCSAI